jgi:carbon-monoxide dehydrogenase large subunit
MAYMIVVRSPHPHALIRDIRTDSAASMPGVLAVFQGDDFSSWIHSFLPVGTAGVPQKRFVPDQFPIAKSESVYQGEPVAAVIATSLHQSADAAELVEVDYEPLPAVLDVRAGAVQSTQTTHSGAKDNVAWEASFEGGQPDRAFAEAELVIRQRIEQQRLAPIPLEGRAVLADFSQGDQQLTLWTSTQVPHFIRMFLAQALGLAESRVRVIAPDVGGGFGCKLRPYPEEYLAAACSRRLGRPVKWTETRTENLQATNHGRGQSYDLEVAAKRDGTLLGLRIEQWVDVGAYVGLFGSNPTISIQMSGGCYRWMGIRGHSVGVLTNKMSTDPYRGAGRPEATYLCERAVDLVAGELGLDPADVRRKNFALEFPFVNSFGFEYDSGAYATALDRALNLAGYAELRQLQLEARRQGRYLGIGIAAYVEVCGFGPSSATGTQTEVGLVESAQVRVFPHGSVAVYVGTHAHGQGHDTTFAQIVGDLLGVDQDSIVIKHGDTGEGPAFGYGTYGSRSLAVGGSALRAACEKVIAKARYLAAARFEAAQDDIVYEGGRFQVAGVPSKSASLAELAFDAYGSRIPAGLEPGLDAIAYFDPPNFTYPFGVHLCAVEIDPETGRPTVTKYVAVDDCGNVINPMIVEGQLHGGIAQGIAQALYEEIVYDDASGQLKTATLLDYQIPTVNEMPELILEQMVTPTPTNGLGAKGVGEAGTIGSSAAVINAICDALAPLGVKHVDMPATPERIWNLIVNPPSAAAGDESQSSRRTSS